LNIIKLRLKYLAAANSFCIVFTVFLVAIKGLPYINLFILLVISALIILIISLQSEYRRYKDAMLIIENEILHIQVIRIEQEILKMDTPVICPDRGFVIISCFGILSDSKIIKFNQDKIPLNSIEINQNDIRFTYSLKGVNQKIIILHGKLTKEQIRNIADRFRYETGITPKLVN